jgi:hypothetical protein
LADWRQGDVAFDLDWTVHAYDPALPLTPQSLAAEPSSPPGLVRSQHPGLVLISQTCDIVRDSLTHPLVLVAALVELDEQRAVEARAGKRARYAHVPGAGRNLFADLDYVMTIEKALLLPGMRTRGCRTPDELRAFGRAVGLRFSRFPFPDDVTASLAPLRARLTRRRRSQTDEGRAIRVLQEIRASATPSWDAAEFDVTLLFMPPSRQEAFAAVPEPAWPALLDSWLGLCTLTGAVRSIGGTIVPLDELSAREYLDSDALDLDHLTDPPA